MCQPIYVTSISNCLNRFASIEYLILKSSDIRLLLYTPHIIDLVEVLLTETEIAISISK